MDASWADLTWADLTQGQAASGSSGRAASASVYDTPAQVGLFIMEKKMETTVSYRDYVPRTNMYDLSKALAM